LSNLFPPSAELAPFLAFVEFALRSSLLRFFAPSAPPSQFLEFASAFVLSSSSSCVLHRANFLRIQRLQSSIIINPSSLSGYLPRTFQSTLQPSAPDIRRCQLPCTPSPIRRRRLPLGVPLNPALSGFPGAPFPNPACQAFPECLPFDVSGLP